MSQRVTLEITAKGARIVEGELDKVGKKLSLLDRIGKRASGAMSGIYGTVAGLGAGAAVKRVLDYETAVGKLQAKMVLSTEDAQKLSEQVLNTATSYGIAKEDVLGALMVFQDFGGKVQEGREILEGLAKTAKATSAPLVQLANVAATLINAGMAPEAALKVVQTLSAQADAATVSIESLSGVIANVASSAGIFGERFRGAEGAVRMGAALQVAGSAFAGNAEQARTATLAMMADLAAKSKDIKKAFKIDVFDKDGMRDLNTIMTELEKATGGNIEKLVSKSGTALFGRESMGAVGAFMQAVKDLREDKGVFKALQGATSGKIDEQFKLRMDGVAVNAEKVQKSLAELDRALMVHGGAFVQWFADDLPRGLGTVLGGALALKFSGPLLAASLGAQGAIKGMGAAAGLASYGLGPIVAVGALAYLAGTGLDRLFGISDKLANKFYEWLGAWGETPEQELKRAKTAIAAGREPEKRRRGWTSALGPTETAVLDLLGLLPKATAAPGAYAPAKKGQSGTPPVVVVSQIINKSGVNGLTTRRGEKR